MLSKIWFDWFYLKVNVPCLPKQIITQIKTLIWNREKNLHFLEKEFKTPANNVLFVQFAAYIIHRNITLNL
jgi:hypothetical protein